MPLSRVGLLLSLVVLPGAAQQNAPDPAAPALFQSIASFNNDNGYKPYTALVQNTDGLLYGTTLYGGAVANQQFCDLGCGVIFSTGMLNDLNAQADFCTDLPCPSMYPNGLALGIDGHLYGTTQAGYANYGVVFEYAAPFIDTIYDFCASSPCTDGAVPQATVVQGRDGKLYGTTEGGGAYGYGTVFKVNPTNDAHTTLYSFNLTDGSSPFAALIQSAPTVSDREGSFYGTTYAGGANGGGTVFRINPSGTLTTLYSFCAQTNCTDGSSPGVLLQAADGDFYGTTQFGGADNAGTIFRMTASGALTTLHSFCAQTNCADGEDPTGLTQGTDGNFYGTTQTGGARGVGTVFQITPAGKLTRLYSFCAQAYCADGANPWGGVIQATNGIFYGTTSAGGIPNESCSECGTVFSVSVGLGPFVKTLPTTGTLGTAVTILGTNLYGATSVTFNGAPAVFTVNSTASAITTSVPAGATTGKVQVITPSGTLTSNLPFQVGP